MYFGSVSGLAIWLLLVIYWLARKTISGLEIEQEIRRECQRVHVSTNKLPHPAPTIPRTSANSSSLKIQVWRE